MAIVGGKLSEGIVVFFKFLPNLRYQFFGRVGKMCFYGRITLCK